MQVCPPPEAELELELAVPADQETIRRLSGDNDPETVPGGERRGAG